VADKRWKRVERESCRALGGERTGPTGRDLPDCIGIHVALEVKSYKRFVFLTKDWEQAVENAAKVGKPPVLRVKQTGQRGRDCVQLDAAYYIVLRQMARSTLALTLPSAGTPIGWFCPLVRLPWNNFVGLYRAAYHIYEEEVIGS
jgi:hypothetical protein